MVPTRVRHDLRLALALALLAAGVVLAGSGQAFAWGTDDAGVAADIVTLLQLKPGDTVAEVGAGHGRMTVRLARAVGRTGRVYSTEIDPDLVAEIRKRVADAHLDNVRVVEATERDTGLPAGCCDGIFMIGVYHHVTDPADTDRSLFEALAPGGRLLINDFPPTFWLRPWTPKGLPPNRHGHGVEAQIVIDEMTQAGLELTRRISPWHPGFLIRSNYALVFQKPVAPEAPPR